MRRMIPLLLARRPAPPGPEPRQAQAVFRAFVRTLEKLDAQAAACADTLREDDR